ncbi:MAG: flagellar biosynthetic protein FliR [Buchnera aphidicola (Meitanaphis elongallis)]
MITFNINDLMSIFFNFLFVVARILSFFMIAPLLEDKSIPKEIKLFTSFIISWFFIWLMPKIDINLFSINGFLILIEQVLIGILLGFIMKLVFSTIKISGEIISFQMGLSFSSVLDVNTHSNTSILSRFLYIFLLLFFLESNGHLLIVSMLFDTFRKIPIQAIELNSSMFLNVIVFSKYIFIDSFMLMLPIIIVQLILNVSIGILNRIASQISIFSIGFTMTLLVGLYILYLFIPFFSHVYNNVFNRLFFLLSIVWRN